MARGGPPSRSGGEAIDTISIVADATTRTEATTGQCRHLLSSPDTARGSAAIGAVSGLLLAGVQFGVVSVETPEELEALKAAGRVVAQAVRAMRREVRAGITTAELDRVGARVFRRAGARSGPQLDYGFPGVNCISVNDEAVHGVPGPRRLEAGDLVKLDVTAELDGFYADACVSVMVSPAAPKVTTLAATARAALQAGIKMARCGTPLNVVGAAVEQEVVRRGQAVCRDLMGHGIGRRIHEPPHVPNVYIPELSQPLNVGLVMTIEPIVSAGSGEVQQANDRWTIRTADAALSAHFEHTVVITDSYPLVLTL